MSKNRCISEYLHDIYFIRHNMIYIGMHVTIILLQYTSHIFFSKHRIVQGLANSKKPIFTQ